MVIITTQEESAVCLSIFSFLCVNNFQNKIMTDKSDKSVVCYWFASLPVSRWRYGVSDSISASSITQSVAIGLVLNTDLSPFCRSELGRLTV